MCDFDTWISANLIGLFSALAIFDVDMCTLLVLLWSNSDL